MVAQMRFPRLLERPRVSKDTRTLLSNFLLYVDSRQGQHTDAGSDSPLPAFAGDLGPSIAF